MQVDVAADLRAEQPREPRHVRRSRQPGGTELFDHALRQPEPQVHPAAARVVAGLDGAEQEPGAGRRQQHPARRRDEDQPAESEQPPGCLREQGPPEPVCEQPRADPHPDQPPRPGQGAQQHRRHHLGGLRLQRRRRDHAVRGRARDRELVEVGGQGADGGMLVDVADHDVGEAGAEPRDQLCRGEAAAAEVEEVVGRGPDLGAEELEPELGEPPHRAVQPTILGPLGGGGQRPRQRVPVHLAGGLGGEHVDHRQPRHQRGRHRVPEQLHGLGLVERGIGRDVPHEELVARSGLAHRGRGPDHARHGQQRRVDLTELDPPAAELDLVVGAATEEQPGRVVHDEVATAVGPLPAEGRHRRVLLGVLGRVEVASQPDASDDQLAGGALRDRLPLGIDHGEVPAVERQPDPDRPLAGQLRTAGDHGGLGRAVGVPHLATGRHQPGGQLGWDRLAAHDQQPYAGQRLHRPQRDQGRDRRHHRDVVGDQPGPDVDAALDQRPRGRDQAGAVPPGQPHLLAGRVEGHREPGHHPVTRAQRVGPGGTSATRRPRTPRRCDG